MLSVTGNFLTGSPIRPDIQTVSIRENGELYLGSSFSTLNKLGYLPLISTFTGSNRSLLSLIHTVAHVALAIFYTKNRLINLQEAKLGVHNFVRGLIEVPPAIGNICALVLDLIRAKKFQKQAKEVMIKNPGRYNIDHVAVFAYGKETAWYSGSEIKAGIGKLPKKETLTGKATINLVCAKGFSSLNLIRG